MIEKAYQNFKDLYQKELLPRQFDIQESRDGVLLARYVGSFPLREKDKDLEVRVTNENGIWKLNSDEALYANRALISLSEVERLPIGLNCNNLVYGPAKSMRFDELINGFTSTPRYCTVKIPLYPAGVGSLNFYNPNAELCRSRLADLQRENYEISLIGFSSEEQQLFMPLPVQENEPQLKTA